jgi:RimJ/RimL family protein N-acetyltransferase
MNAELYVPWLVASTPEVIRHWVGEELLTRSFEQDFHKTIHSRTDLGRAERYRQACPIAGALPSDYCLREIKVLPGLSVIAGIHFYGGDVSRPFVGIYAQSREIEPMEAVEASNHLCHEFSIFKSPHTWWWCAGQRVVSDLPHALKDQCFIVGNLEEIRRCPLPCASLRVTLRADPGAESYDLYAGIYDRFIELNPKWKGRIEKTERELYIECAQAGGLYKVEAANACVGVIAARPGVIRGISGWEVIEEILDENVRGRGVAAHVQRLFLDQLDLFTSRLVLGTVDYENEASRRTALRAGRQDVGGWIFLPGN